MTWFVDKLGSRNATSPGGQQSAPVTPASNKAAAPPPARAPQAAQPRSAPPPTKPAPEPEKKKKGWF